MAVEESCLASLKLAIQRINMFCEDAKVAVGACPKMPKKKKEAGSVFFLVSICMRKIIDRAGVMLNDCSVHALYLFKFGSSIH